MYLIIFRGSDGSTTLRTPFACLNTRIAILNMDGEKLAARRDYYVLVIGSAPVGG
jgi:hypothetical protein